MKQWIHALLTELVEEPEYLKIEEKIDDQGILYTISTSNKKDTIVLIGKKGDHINALRVITRIKGRQMGQKVSLKIIG